MLSGRFGGGRTAWRAQHHEKKGEITQAIPVTQIIADQIMRSGTSVAANYRAACRARSKAEFIAKLSIVVEEADETVLWLELIRDGRLLSESRIKNLLDEANEITAIMVASRKTASS